MFLRGKSIKLSSLCSCFILKRILFLKNYLGNFYIYNYISNIFFEKEVTAAASLLVFTLDVT